jgi:hypothetical protein
MTGTRMVCTENMFVERAQVGVVGFPEDCSHKPEHLVHAGVEEV